MRSGGLGAVVAVGGILGIAVLVGQPPNRFYQSGHLAECLVTVSADRNRRSWRAVAARGQLSFRAPQVAGAATADAVLTLMTRGGPRKR